MDSFSRRQQPKSAEYNYEITETIRVRIMTTVGQLIEMRINVPRMMEELGNIVIRSIGEFRTRGVMVTMPTLIDHLSHCDDAEFLDVVEYLFHTRENFGGQSTVREINKIFDEENLGYELTPFVTIHDPVPSYSMGKAVVTGVFTTRIQFPKIILKTEKILHASTVEPALQVMSDPRFATANGELVDGLVKLRNGQYQESIQTCGSAIESVLKTICTLKQWAYVEHKDNLSELLEICRGKGLFFPFYASVLNGTGTMRNKMSAHGKGPNPEIIPQKEHAEHMAYTCCANAVLLVSLAKL